MTDETAGVPHAENLPPSPVAPQRTTVGGGVRWARDEPWNGGEIASVGSPRGPALLGYTAPGPSISLAAIAEDGTTRWSRSLPGSSCSAVTARFPPALPDGRFVVASYPECADVGLLATTATFLATDGTSEEVTSLRRGAYVEAANTAGELFGYAWDVGVTPPPPGGRGSPRPCLRKFRKDGSEAWARCDLLGARIIGDAGQGQLYVLSTLAAAPSLVLLDDDGATLRTTSLPEKFQGTSFAVLSDGSVAFAGISTSDLWWGGARGRALAGLRRVILVAAPDGRPRAMVEFPAAEGESFETFLVAAPGGGLVTWWWDGSQVQLHALSGALDSRWSRSLPGSVLALAPAGPQTLLLVGLSSASFDLDGYPLTEGAFTAGLQW